MNYYIKYNEKSNPLCPWELWFGYEKIECFVTKYSASEKADNMNNSLVAMLKK